MLERESKANRKVLKRGTDKMVNALYAIFGKRKPEDSESGDDDEDGSDGEGNVSDAGASEKSKGKQPARKAKNNNLPKGKKPNKRTRQQR